MQSKCIHCPVLNAWQTFCFFILKNGMEKHTEAHPQTPRHTHTHTQGSGWTNNTCKMLMSPIPFSQLSFLCILFFSFPVCFWSPGLLRCLLVINFLLLPAGTFHQFSTSFPPVSSSGKAVANMQYSPGRVQNAILIRSLWPAFVPLTISEYHRPWCSATPSGRRRFVCLLTNSFVMATTAAESLGNGTPSASMLGLWHNENWVFQLHRIMRYSRFWNQIRHISHTHETVDTYHFWKGTTRPTKH